MPALRLDRRGCLVWRLCRRVVGNDLRCYFHQWRYDELGALVDVPALPCGPLPTGVR